MTFNYQKLRKMTNNQHFQSKSYHNIQMNNNNTNFNDFYQVKMIY